MTVAVLDRPDVQAALRAELARRELGAFCERLDPTYERSRHADLLIRHLEAVERGDVRRLAVFMPPRHSKTYHVSERFPAWLLGREPTAQVILASYGAELAERNSRVVRNLLRDERWPFRGVRVAEDSAAVNRWSTNHGGIVVAAGVGGAMTGFGAHVLIVDDPVKGRLEADSEVTRETTWNWYTEVARTRLMPGGRIVACQTRWHEDDLAGRILNSSGAADWTVLDLPALAPADQPDPLGRRPGEPLWPEWYDGDALDEIRRDLTSEQGSRAWHALYQQRPTADEGGLFKRAWFAQRYDAAPERMHVVLAVDAAYKTGVANDYSAIVAAGTDRLDHYVLDVRRERLEYPELRRAIVDAAAQWRPTCVLIEDTAAGQSAIQELRRMPGLPPIVPMKVTASKQARATAVAPLAEAGKVKLPSGKNWTGALLDELAAFPAGRHDDQVDALVLALQRLAEVAASSWGQRQTRPMTMRPGALGGRQQGRGR